MTTLALLRCALPVLTVAMALAPPAHARVDEDWLRMWRVAQRHRPRVLASTGRIAPRDEPGTPLVVEGRVFGPDGTTPASHVVVFAYHADREGIYFGPGEPGAPWRLQGWAETDESGRFELRTIRPGPYPDRSEPAHVHVTLESPEYGSQWTPSLRFADDPLVTREEKARSEAVRPFGHVGKVRIEDGVAHVRLLVRLKFKPDF